MIVNIKFKIQDVSMTIIKCNDVSLSYDKNTVLSELSFSVEKGTYLCIVGENGSGKSTLMKALLGLHPIAEGTVIYPEGFSKKNISYLSQQNDLQKDFPASVYEIVLSGRLSHKRFLPFYNKKDRMIAHDAMNKLGICDLGNRSFRELSGGQRQRVLLARAIASEAELLFVDEPTTGLDPVVTADLYRLIKTLQLEGKTVVMVTHDIACAVEHATHILHLHNKPLFFGTTDDYRNSEVGRRYLGQ